MPLTPEGIKGWTDLFYDAQKQGAFRPFLKDLAQGERDLLVAEAGVKSAQNQFAPQYFGSQAEDMTNQAGLSGVELQYAPQFANQAIENNGLASQIKRLELDALRRELSAPPGFNTEMGKIIQEQNRINNEFGADSQQAQIYNQWVKGKLGGAQEFASPMAKAQQDRDKLVSMHGENSPKVAEFDQYLNKQFGVNKNTLDPNNIMLDPNTGDPLINISGTKASNGRYSGGTYLNPKTSEIYGFQTTPSKTRDFKTLAGTDNVKMYVNSIKKQAPSIYLMTTAAGKGWTSVAKHLNATFGTNFEAPSAEAFLDASIKSFAEGFINQFGLNATNENVNKAESIIRPRYGERTKSYLNRINAQLKDFAAIKQRAESRLSGGQKIGFLGGKQGPVNDETLQLYLGNIPAETLKVFNSMQPKPQAKKVLTFDRKSGGLK